MGFITQKPSLLKRVHWRKGERHARKRDKTLCIREKGTGLPDSGARPHKYGRPPLLLRAGGLMSVGGR